MLQREVLVQSLPFVNHHACRCGCMLLTIIPALCYWKKTKNKAINNHGSQKQQLSFSSMNILCYITIIMNMTACETNLCYCHSCSLSFYAAILLLFSFSIQVAWGLTLKIVTSKEFISCMKIN